MERGRGGRETEGKRQERERERKDGLNEMGGPICTETTHWGTILERIGPCLRVISEVKHRPT